MKPQACLLPSNQFDHFYKGGDRIGKLRNGPGGPMRPEEWIGSVTTRFGEAEQGLSKLPDGRLLKDAIAADPVAWLGEVHYTKFGTSTEILVKLLDPEQRLPVHFHPDVPFARKHLGLAHGKTEAWLVLEAPAGARVGLGFKDVMQRDQINSWVLAQDSDSLLESLDRFEVKAGDVIFVPAGVAHAIDSGIFVLELQEPTDLSILLEWNGFAVDGLKDGHLDLGFDLALDALRLTPLSATEKAQCISKFNLSQNLSHRIFSKIADDFFQADFIANSEQRYEASFAIFLVLQGEGEITFSDGNPFNLKIGDALLIPHSAGEFSVSGAKGILCRPRH